MVEALYQISGRVMSDYDVAGIAGAAVIDREGPPTSALGFEAFGWRRYTSTPVGSCLFLCFVMKCANRSYVGQESLMLSEKGVARITVPRDEGLIGELYCRSPYN